MSEVAGAMRGSAGSASGVRGCDGSPVSDTKLYAWRESRVVACYVPGEEAALVIVPAELLQVLIPWKCWVLGLEGLAFIKVSLGVDRDPLASALQHQVGFEQVVVLFLFDVSSLHSLPADIAQDLGIFGAGVVQPRCRTVAS